MTAEGQVVNNANNGNGITCRSVQLDTKTATCMENEDPKKGDRQKTPLFYGGEKGALFLIIFAPIFVMVINLMCTKDSCTITKLPSIPTDISVFFNIQSLFMFLFFIFMNFLFNSIPLGAVLEGEPQPNGKTLKYRMNGIWIIFFFLLLVIASAALKAPVHLVYLNTTSFIVLSTISAFAVSTYLYFRSFEAPTSELSIYGNTGNVVYDFFMGRELNPRIGDIDIKKFCIRFGLASWIMYDLGLVWSQTHQYGFATPSLLLSVFGSVLFMLDHFVFEETMLTSFTVNHQGTGFLLVFGSFVFVPYVYTLHSRLLLELNYNLSEPMLIGIFIFMGTSHVFYRLVNADIITFIRYPDDPLVLDYDYIDADNGNFLLVDGWWAVVRHPNYVADMMMALSWCLTSGFNDLISYIYFVFIVIFYLHHTQHNENMSKRKFGKAWGVYCQKVQQKLIKWVY